MRLTRTVATLLAFCSLAPDAVAQELSSSVSLTDRPIRAFGKLFASAERPLRSLIVIMEWGVGRQVYEDPTWRAAANKLGAGLLLLDVGTTAAPPSAGQLPPEQQVIRNAALGGGDALIALIDRFSQNPGYSELKKAPLLIWGFSASGSFATTFATAHPERTVGFVRFHSHARGLPVDTTKLARTAALLIAGGSDSTAGVDDAGDVWRKGRAIGAPWTLAIHPDQQHGQGVRESQEFQLAWIAAVIRQRVAEDGSLRQVSTEWMLELNTGNVVPAADAKVARSDMTWVPDERSAQLWQALTGKRPK